MTRTARFAEHWAEQYPRPDPSTNGTHASMAKLIGAYFGDTPLEQITRADARQFALKHPGHLRYARTMMLDALDDGLVTRNPFASLGIRRPQAKVEVPSLVELDALIDRAPRPLDSMIRFAAFTGVRLGEQLALVREHIGDGRVHVNAQLDKRGARKPCKADSARAVLVPPQALPLPAAPPSGLAAADSYLWPYARSTHHRDWAAVQDRLAYRYKWHSLRHFCATWLLNLGASPEDVAVQLGHSDGGALVRSTYGHADPELALDRLRGLTA